MPTTPEGSSGLNLKLYYYGTDDSPLTLTEVPKVYEVGETGGAAPDRVELTHHGVTDFIRRYAPSFRDPGTVPVACNFLPGNAVHQQIIADSAAQTSRRWRLEFPTNAEDYVEFDGAPSVRTAQPMEDRLSLMFDITVEGAYTFNYADEA